VTTLEQALRALAVEWPATPDLASAVGPRLVAAPQRRRAWLRPVAIAIAIVVLASVAALALSPGARSSILRFFHLRGATIERVEQLPPVQPGTTLGLGRPVPLDVARKAVTFPIRLPDAPKPTRVLLDETIGRGAVSVVWCCPRTILSEFRGDAISYVEKMAGPGTSVEYLAVEGRPGVWVAGRAHAVIFRDELGRIVDEPRLARNVLLWEAEDGVTYRLEGDMTRERALAIAAGLR
jgi:hypothetical protein